jgi:hypothetical protein
MVMNKVEALAVWEQHHKCHHLYLLFADVRDAKLWVACCVIDLGESLDKLQNFLKEQSMASNS